MSKHNKPHELTEQTRELLKTRDESLAALSRRTGIPYWWLHDLDRDRIAEPSANRILHLYEALTGRKVSA